MSRGQRHDMKFLPTMEVEGLPDRRGVQGVLWVANRHEVDSVGAQVEARCFELEQKARA